MKTYVIAIAVLLVINVILVKKVFDLEKKSKKEDDQELQFLQDEYLGLFEKGLSECLDNNSVIDSTFDVINSNGGIVSISDALSFSDSKFKLIIRWSEENCATCFTRTYDLIKKYSPLTDPTNILYFGLFKDLSTLNSFIMESFGNVNRFNLIQKFGLQVEEYKQPYIFILDDKNIIHNIYIIKKGNQDQLEKYLDFAFKKYFHIVPPKLPISSSENHH